MNQAVALNNINTEAVVGSFTQSELDTLKATIARGTTNEQFALFVQTCARSGLNPFLNQVYCIVYNGKDGPVMSIQIAVEGIVALAKRHPQYKGFIASEVKENDEFEIDVVTGEPKHRITTMQRGKTIGAYCVAYREGAPNIAVVITNDQVEHLLKGRNGQMWKDYFDDMIVKHAIKRAFKRQFGIEVAEDEHNHGGTSADSIPEYQPRKDITPNREVIDVPKQASEDDEATKMKTARAEMKKKFELLGITEPADMAKYIEQHAKPKGDKPTLAEITGLLKIMDMHIAEKQEQASSADELT
ncbi:RecT family recombinase [Brevibacillus sp. HD3.3A]|uniref:RecT family recombinase n=1 Tax=Brevibacillus sp. HD3.3A TaxID=2738979 RepID=UPI00156B6644|nr:RecT family recombinase [Brevibacillus sp. HD3.3A]UED70737.1 recombinase RecT [Brevibacillus sp. HD3.3A]